MLIVLSKEQNIIQITNMFQERGRWRKGKKKKYEEKEKDLESAKEKSRKRD